MRNLVLLILFGVSATAQQRTQHPKAVWIDTDPSVAPGGHEIDDGIALLQAFASAELDIRGVSVVFGNADLPTASRIGRDIVSKFSRKPLPFYVGAASASDLGKENEATLALEQALRKNRLTILVLGPATNIATVVRNHPELARNIDELVAVAARRPGQRFVASARQAAGFRDFNFELDPEAFRVLIESRVPVVFAPWEVSSHVWITRADLNAAAASNPGVAWLLPAAIDWLARWKRNFDADGFNPFDALAVGYLVDRADIVCSPFSASIETGPDDSGDPASPSTKPYLLVRTPVAGRPQVTYCFDVKPGFKPDLLRRLSGK